MIVVCGPGRLLTHWCTVFSGTGLVLSPDRPGRAHVKNAMGSGFAALRQRRFLYGSIVLSTITGRAGSILCGVVFGLQRVIECLYGGELPLDTDVVVHVGAHVHGVPALRGNDGPVRTLCVEQRDGASAQDLVVHPPQPHLAECWADFVVPRVVRPERRFAVVAGEDPGIGRRVARK